MTTEAAETVEAEAEALDIAPEAIDVTAPEVPEKRGILRRRRTGQDEPVKPRRFPCFDGLQGHRRHQRRGGPHGIRLGVHHLLA